jgi:hypothetical protein
MMENIGPGNDINAASAAMANATVPRNQKA